MSLPLPRFYAHITNAQDARAIERNLQEAGPVEAPATVARATLPGDRRRLRGIPVVGGVSGTSPGTDPYAETERKMRTR